MLKLLFISFRSLFFNNYNKYIMLLSMLLYTSYVYVLVRCCSILHGVFLQVSLYLPHYSSDHLFTRFYRNTNHNYN
jgi:hypothetical protein